VCVCVCVWQQFITFASEFLLWGGHVYLTCLTCAGDGVPLLALPHGDGHVVDGDVSLEARASDSFKHDLFGGEKTKETDGRWVTILLMTCSMSNERKIQRHK